MSRESTYALAAIGSTLLSALLWYLAELPLKGWASVYVLGWAFNAGMRLNDLRDER